MKRFALIAGAVFLLIGIAGFAGMFAILPMYSAALVAGGAAFTLYGATHRRAIVPPRGPGSDMRDLGGA